LYKFTKVFLTIPDRFSADRIGQQIGVNMSDKAQKGGKQESSGFGPCKFKGCKHNPSKYGFCGDHFDQFKFGLLTKNGDWCPDYEKKWDQYQVHKAKFKVA
jgi:hypothetical protein